jgi:hypothetical protein
MNDGAERGFTLLGMVGVVLLSSWQDNLTSGSFLQRRTGL